LIVTEGPPVKRHALDHVRIERALREEIGAADLLRLFLEHVDEGLADELALGLGVSDAGEAVEKQLSAFTWTSGMLYEPRNRLTTCSASPMPHQAVVDEHAGQLVADRLVDQHRRDRESTPPESPQITLPLPTCLRISAILVLRNSAMVQSPLSPQTWRTKLAISLPPSGCGPPRGGTGSRRTCAAVVGDHREGRAVGGRDGRKPGANGDLVAVAHPHLMRSPFSHSR
jgi:hypothetical protein